MPSACYFEGDFYQARAATTPGQSPATTPTKWARQGLPAAWRRYLIESAVARLLPGEGKADLARAAAKDAAVILEEMQIRHHNTQTNHATALATVKTR